MSNSALANYINRVNGNYVAREEMIDRIMVHCSGQPGDRYDMAELINGGSSGYHYGISTDGAVGLFTDEYNAANGCSVAAINQRCVHILCMTENESPKMPISKETADILFKLIDDICRRNFIRELTYTGRPEGSNLLCHSWYDSTSCPGQIIKGMLPSLASRVTASIKSARTTSELDAIKAQSTISVGATDPYVAIPGASAVGVNYNNLKTLGCIGALFWAGSYYDTNHVAKQKYINPNLKQQVSEITNQTHQPFGLYADVRAKNVREAKLECYELFFVIAKYSPNLGLWLHIDSKASQGAMIEIIEYYYKKIVEWGLKARCGFYITTDTANKINWPHWTDKFALWLIDPPSGLSDVTQSILTPSLFKL